MLNLNVLKETRGAFKGLCVYKIIKSIINNSIIKACESAFILTRYCIFVHTDTSNIIVVLKEVSSLSCFMSLLPV